VVVQNIIRTWLPQYLLPFGLTRVLYLDSDILVQQDPAAIFATPLTDDQLVAVAAFISRVSWRLLPSRFLTAAGLQPDEIFNAGVILFNLVPFCRAAIPQLSIDILQAQNETGRLYVGTITHQAALILAIGNRRAAVDFRFNTCEVDAILLHCPGYYRREPFSTPSTSMPSQYVAHQNDENRPQRSTSSIIITHKKSRTLD
jgi:lipopolysaccharide biosynthesis glycosyltransferase